MKNVFLTFVPFIKACEAWQLVNEEIADVFLKKLVTGKHLLLIITSVNSFGHKNEWTAT